MSAITPHCGLGWFRFQFELPPLDGARRERSCLEHRLKTFKLKVKWPQPCSECSQCLSVFSSFFFFFLFHCSALHSTVTQEYRHKGLRRRPGFSVTTSIDRRRPHRTHEHMHSHNSGLLPLQATTFYMKMTFGCICQRSICSRIMKRSLRLSVWSSVWVINWSVCLCSKKCTWLFWSALFSIVNLVVRPYMLTFF